MSKLRELKTLDDLKLDELNFNKHTPEGMKLLKESIERNKLGRSVLTDKDGNLIAGNGVTETLLKNAKGTKIKVVDSDGTELVVVRRTDLEIDSKEARELAFLDNYSSSKNLQWDTENIEAAKDEFGLDLDIFGYDEFDSEEVSGEVIDEETLRTLIEESSKGSIQDYSEDTDYDLGNLYRRKGNVELKNKLDAGEKSGAVRREIAELCRLRMSQLTFFNYDEIIKYYRSDDCSEDEKELLKKLYLVFITPKEAVEEGLLRMDAASGRIYELELNEELNS